MFQAFIQVYYPQTFSTVTLSLLSFISKIPPTARRSQTYSKLNQALTINDAQNSHTLTNSILKMDLSQIDTCNSSYALMRSNDTRIVQIPKFHNESRSSFDIQRYFQVSSTTYPQRAPFFEDQTSTNMDTETEDSVESSPKALNRGSIRVHPQQKTSKPKLRGVLAAETLRRRQIEQSLRRDSGIAFNASNGNQTALSAIPMDLAMRMENGTPPPEPFEIETAIPETPNTKSSINPGSQTPALSTTEKQSQLQIPEPRNKDLSINTDRSRSNSRRTGLKGNHILDRFTPTTMFNQNRKRQLSKERDIDATSLMFREIEGKDGETQKKILEGHLDKIFRIVPPPLSEGPEREVQFVGRIVGADQIHSARFGDAEAERGMKAFLKGGNLWQKTVGRVKGAWGKVRPRRQI